MRLLKWLASTMLLMIILAVPVMAAQPRHHLQDYEITIMVESVEQAAAIINGLSGYNLDAVVSLGTLRPDATFRRRVDDWAYRQVQDTLRSMGTVLSEFETVTYLGNELLDLEAQLEINAGEIERLSQMLEESDSLNVMTLLSNRLGELTRTRDWLLGRRNQILVQTGSPVINIRLIQAIEPTPDDDEEEEEPPTFIARLGDSFTASINGLGTFFGHVLVVIAYISVPLGLWMLLCTPVILVLLKRRKNSKTVAVVREDDAK